MTRFDSAYDEGDLIPYGLWDNIVSNALSGRRGQTALAMLEEALLALPEKKLISGALAAEGSVCAVGAYVAYRRARDQGEDLHAVIAEMAAHARCDCGHDAERHPDGGACRAKRADGLTCWCKSWAPEEDVWSTTEVGQRAGLRHALAWHLAQLNDEQYRTASPEERYELMLAWVRRAQGKVTA